MAAGLRAQHATYNLRVSCLKSLGYRILTACNMLKAQYGQLFFCWCSKQMPAMYARKVQPLCLKCF